MTSQVIPVPLPNCGKRGLNIRDRYTPVGADWMVACNNLWIDRQGVLQCRPAAANITTTPSVTSRRIVKVFSSVTSAGAVTNYAQLVSNTTGLMTDFTLLTDTSASKVTGTSVAGTSSEPFAMVNFNGLSYAIKQGQTAKRISAGNWIDWVPGAGAVPTGSVLTAAFGRLWGVDSDGQTVKYCFLLDGQTWTGSDAGSIDMRTIWGPDGDKVTAIAQSGSQLIVFGSNHVVFWEDGSGSRIGLDPIQMAVVDIIRGTGCIFRDSVCTVMDGDLLFMAKDGVRSLSRLVASKNSPTQSLSKYVNGQFIAGLAGYGAFPTNDLCQACYSPEMGCYLVYVQAAGATGVWVFHVTRMYQDEEGDVVCPVTFWNAGVCVNYDPVTRQINGGFTNSSTSAVAIAVKMELNKLAVENVTTLANPTGVSCSFITARHKPAAGRLLSSRGLKCDVRHTATSGTTIGRVRIAGWGSEDNYGIDDGLTSTVILNAGQRFDLTNSTGKATNESGIVGSIGSGEISSYQLEELVAEVGGDGEWVQYSVAMDETNNTAYVACGFADFQCYLEVDRNI